MAKYARPPIAESAFELRFGSPFSLREIERLRDRLKRHYPAVDEQKQVDVRIEPTGVVTDSRLVGYKMTAANGCDIVLVNLSALGTVRLAPYDSWEQRIIAAQTNYEIMTKIVSRADIVRLGARYINRIDLPKSTGSEMSSVSFLRLGVAIPRELSTTVGPYSLSASFKESSTGVNILIQSAIVQPPPLIDQVSLLLDIDASIELDIPARIDDVWSLSDKLRQAKNKVFEACVTDDARKLFG